AGRPAAHAHHPRGSRLLVGLVRRGRRAACGRGRRTALQRRDLLVAGRRTRRGHRARAPLDRGRGPAARRAQAPLPHRRALERALLVREPARDRGGAEGARLPRVGEGGARRGRGTSHQERHGLVRVAVAVVARLLLRAAASAAATTTTATATAGITSTTALRR